MKHDFVPQYEWAECLYIYWQISYFGLFKRAVVKSKRPVNKFGQLSVMFAFRILLSLFKQFSAVGLAYGF